MNNVKNAAIVTTIREFLEDYSVNRFVAECEAFVKNECRLPVQDGNRHSWIDCYQFLKTYLPKEQEYVDFHLIFEFLMPESMRRSDVILLTNKKVFVLEFKQKDKIKKADIAQAAGYSRSISHYHFKTSENNMESVPYMVYTQGIPCGRSDLVEVLHSKNFTIKLKDLLKNQKCMTMEERKEWVKSPFRPLKNLAEATLQLFKEGNLPNIKNIRDGDIQGTLNAINTVIFSKDLKKNIIFVAGVPGAGKTLVGLKTVYDHGNPDQLINPIYLSGNDPLVNILQNTLSKNKVDKDGESYIQPLKDFKKMAYLDTVPMNKIIVFDEAQRAWDIAKPPYKNEAEEILAIGEKIYHEYGEITVICLIGEGQAIHKNEETGIPMWAEALKNKTDWNVSIPEKYKQIFIDIPIHIVPELMLDTSIRNDFINVSP